MYGYQKKTLAVIITFVLLFASMGTVNAQPSDLSGHWAETVMQRWIDFGVLQGAEGNYKPNNNISRAEFVVLVNRVLKPLTKSNVVFEDVLDSQWFGQDISKAVEAGFIQGDGKGKFKPTANITRQEAAVVLYKAFDMQPGNVFALNLYADSKEVADWAKDAVAALVENNYMTGKPGNRLAAKDNITRAETINLLNKIAAELKYKAGTYTGNIEGSVVINTPDVVLKDMTIKGNLYIAQGVGEGDVYLDNITVMGRTIVKGGGQNSIRIKNSSLNGTLYVIKKDGMVRIILIENTSVANVEIGGNVKLTQEDLSGEGYGNVTVIPMAAGAEIVIEGDIEELTIQAPNTSIEVLDGTVGTFTIANSAANTAVELAKEAVVETLTVEAKSEITGTGTIEKIVSDSKDVTIDEKLTTPTTPVVTPPTSGGGGGGGGSTTPSKPNVYINSAKLRVDGNNITVEGDGKNYAIDLKLKPNTTTISGITISAPAGAELTVTSVESNMATVTLNNKLALANEISVLSLLGNSGNSNVSLSSMRSIFGTYVKVNGTLSCNEYSSTSVSFTINLSDTQDPTANIPNEWVTVATNDTTVTATIKAGKGITTLASIGVATFLSETIGELPVEVTIGTSVCKVTDADYYGDIKAALTSVTSNADWNQVTLADLVGKVIKFKKSGDTKLYTVNVVL